jgi:hypothetical protein
MCALGLALIAAGCGEETTEPEPIVFSCEAVAKGDSLSSSGTVDGDTVEVRISSDNGSFSKAPEILDVSSGTLGAVTVDGGVVQVPISGAGSSTAFTLDGSLTGPRGDSCDVERRFTVTVGGGGVTVD